MAPPGVACCCPLQSTWESISPEKAQVKRTRGPARMCGPHPGLRSPCGVAGGDLSVCNAHHVVKTRYTEEKPEISHE